MAIKLCHHITSGLFMIPGLCRNIIFWHWQMGLFKCTNLMLLSFTNVYFCGVKTCKYVLCLAGPQYTYLSEISFQPTKYFTASGLINIFVFFSFYITSVASFGLYEGFTILCYLLSIFRTRRLKSLNNSHLHRANFF